MEILITFLLVFTGCFIGIGWWLSTRAYAGPVSDHFDGTRFVNPAGVKAQGLGKVFKWMFKREKGAWQDLTARKSTLSKPASKSNPATHVYFINHSSFLIQIDGINILTDPVYSERVSPFQFAGPKRMRQPGIAFTDLPPVDLILLSHNHYDHLDLPTVKKLSEKFDPQFIVPLGVRHFLANKGIDKVKELDWWDHEVFLNLKILSTPAQHFSGRGLFDRDRSLWCGFSIKGRDKHILYIGDTGHGTFFDKFPEVIGPPDLAIIPIGAYKPKWFMKPIHCSPAQAIEIHEMVQATKSVACHHGTFPLGDDGMDEPAQELAAARSEKGIASDTFVILQNGHHLQI